MFESPRHRLASLSVFALRMLGCGAISLLIVCIALAIGMIGYHQLAHLDWVDSLLNASMILGGMGPVSPLTNDEAKIFASCYALFSGLVLVMLMGLLLAPLAHRLLHRMHLDDRDLSNDSESR